jgi:hypothetical protein
MITVLVVYFGHANEMRMPLVVYCAVKAQMAVLIAAVSSLPGTDTRGPFTPTLAGADAVSTHHGPALVAFDVSGGIRYSFAATMIDADWTINFLSFNTWHYMHLSVIIRLASRTDLTLTPSMVMDLPAIVKQNLWFSNT